MVVSSAASSLTKSFGGVCCKHTFPQRVPAGWGGGGFHTLTRAPKYGQLGVCQRVRSQSWFFVGPETFHLPQLSHVFRLRQMIQLYLLCLHMEQGQAPSGCPMALFVPQAPRPTGAADTARSQM